MKRVLVINPNSSGSVTRAIDEALVPFRFDDGPRLEAVTLSEGPAGIVTMQDVARVAPLLCRYISQNAADGYVLACFSDPGLAAAREAAGGRAVLGVGQCSYATALTAGEKFGVIAIADASVKRQQAAVRAMGLDARYAGSLPIRMSPSESAEPSSFHRIEAVARELCQAKGADVLIFGCAGMAGHCRRLEDSVGVPVIEPTQAAAAMMIGQLQKSGTRSSATDRENVTVLETRKGG